MGKKSTFTGYLRARGNSSNSTRTGPTPAVLRMTLAVTIDPAATVGTATGKFLPAGAVILHATIMSAHAGGTAPLTDVGLTGDTDSIIDGAVATSDLEFDVVTGATSGVAFGVATTADLEVVAGTGGGTPGTGTAVIYITYSVTDDGALAT